MKNIIFSLVVFLFFTTTINLFSQKEDQQSKSSELKKKVQVMHKKRRQMIDDYLKEHRPEYWKLRRKILERVQKGGSFASYKEEATLSDLVILGEVIKIEHNFGGPYHTWVTVRIDSLIKGRVDKESIVVKLLTGPTDNEGGHFELGLEPKFSIGENVLLFLTTIPKNLWLMGGPEYLERGKEHLAHYSSYFFQKYKVVPDGYEPRTTLKVVDENVVLPGENYQNIWEFIESKIIKD